jgi:hypothetical protein
MGMLFGSVKIAKVLLRNQLRLKPLGRKASHVVIEYLRTNHVPFRSVEVWMGLAEADGMSCLVFFSDDEVLASFTATDGPARTRLLFQEALSKVGYPADAIPRITVTFHSDEAIERAGGPNNYFH